MGCRPSEWSTSPAHGVEARRHVSAELGIIVGADVGAAGGAAGQRASDLRQDRGLLVDLVELHDAPRDGRQQEQRGAPEAARVRAAQSVVAMRPISPSRSGA